jgi:hypothetical protein
MRTMEICADGPAGFRVEVYQADQDTQAVRFDGGLLYSHTLREWLPGISGTFTVRRVAESPWAPNPQMR